MNWVQWFTFIIALLPQVLQLVVQVEQALGPGTGAQKKEAVLANVDAQAQALGADADQQVQARTIAGGLIDSHVASLNATGTFRHRDAGAGMGARAKAEN